MTVNEYQPFASTGFEAGLVSWLSEDKSRVNESAEHQASTMPSRLRGSTTTFTVGLYLDGQLLREANQTHVQSLLWQ